MRRTLLYALAALWAMGLASGCGKKTHPVKVYVDDSFAAGELEKIAVFPFSSAVSPVSDPDRRSSRTFDQLFRAELDKRSDYKWVAPGSVQYVLDRGGVEGGAQSFVDDWRQKRVVNKELLDEIGKALKVDAVLVGVVELWQQDEVDPRENAVPATYVGATVTIFDVKDGKVLFEASDEDMLEGMRSEDRDKQIIRSGSGQIYSDPTGSMYKAPPFEEVAVKVAQALAQSIPKR